MRLRAPPGRAGRPWLIHRLAVANRGARVLDDKRRALLREHARVAVLAVETRQAWEDAARVAETWHRRALLVSGQRSLDLAAFYVTERASVRLTWRRSLGTWLPSEVRYAASAYGRAVEAGARYAAARLALERIESELASAIRRLRALERRWIPAHEQALAALALALDETEREDALRTRWFAELQAADDRELPG
jgi:V/A-type H+-transporting ATPase subunit D